MRRGVACVVAVSVFASIGALALRASVAGARPHAFLVDYYITGEVVGRAPGKNAASVELRWDYKCLGDRLGPATFSWTLKLRRQGPGSARTVSLGIGTSKSGNRRVVVPPGRWQPLADPFRCETERGAGSTTPELGREFDVPDYCGWSVSAVKGRATVERRGSVEALRRAGSVSLGDVISTGRRSSLGLRDSPNASTLSIGPNTRVTVHRRYCPATGAWKHVVARGTVAAELRASVAKGRYELQSSNARTTSARGAWSLTSGRTGAQQWTRVAVRANRVTVANVRGGRAVVVRAGHTTVVRGSSPPSRPRRS
jgi:hypothetical protein